MLLARHLTSRPRPGRCRAPELDEGSRPATKENSAPATGRVDQIVSPPAGMVPLSISESELVSFYRPHPDQRRERQHSGRSRSDGSKGHTLVQDSPAAVAIRSSTTPSA